MLGIKARVSLGAGSSVLLLLLSATPAMAADPSTPPPSSAGAASPQATWDPNAVPAHFPGGAAKLNAAAQATQAVAAAFQPSALGDNVHVTAGDASGHGWWLQGSCSNVKTPVTISLFEYFSDGTWRQKGTEGYANVYPGGGSANRANARATCASLTPGISWKSVVNVSIGNGSTRAQFSDIACAV
jgi:hypothetical protein